MKYLQRLFILFAISAASFSCQKEYSVENPTGSNTPTAQWEFKEAGVQFKGPVDTVAIDTIGTYKFLTINGRSTDGNSQITLQVFGADLKVGTYKTPSSLFAYLTAGNPVYQTDQTSTDSFTITITKIDTTGVTGTFSGNALSGNNVKKIVDGKFNAVFKKIPVTPSTTDSGQVVLWSKAACSGGTNPIAVTVGGKSGSITQFSATAPSSCTAAGSYSVKLPVGTYPWVAKCGTDSVSGTVTVTKDGCTKQEVDFSAAVAGDYFPTTKNSNWSYLYEASTADDTLYTVSTGNNKTFGANSYSLFTNTDGSSKDSSYYRKPTGTGNYFEYLQAFTDTAAGGIAIPAFEYIFLKDNVIKGTKYVAATVAATIQGLPVTMVINSEVLDITTVTVGTQALPVIKMRHVYAYKIGTTSTDFYAIEEWFAKGVGLIKYIDYSSPPFTAPSDVLNLTRATIF